MLHQILGKMERIQLGKIHKFNYCHIFQLIFLILVIGGTFLWALSFINVYAEPMPRIEASEWIYRNIKSSVNLELDNGLNTINHPIAYPRFLIMEKDQKIDIKIKSQFSGEITEISFNEIDVVDPSNGDGFITLHLYNPQDLEKPFWVSKITNSEIIENSNQGTPLVITINPAIKVAAEDELYLAIQYSGEISKVKLRSNVQINVTGQVNQKQTVYEFASFLTSDQPYVTSFSPIETGELKSISFFRVLNNSKQSTPIRLKAKILDQSSSEVLTQGVLSDTFAHMIDFRGADYQIRLDKPIKLDKEKKYTLLLEVSGENENPALTFYGSQVAKETDWDDALPLYMYGLNPFDQNYGLYPSDLNFQMYWDDNSEKRERFISNLEKADYFIITSNRQWGSTTQIPERFPMTTYFYNELIGCPDGNVQNCYREAVPGLYSGRLGFDLERVFYTYPKLLGIEFNSQYAEEAFSVYDHPKVLIFRKSANFSLSDIYDQFHLLDLDNVLPINPAEANKRPGLLMLTQIQMEKQRNSGTWSDLFDYASLQNRNPIVTILVWYFFILILGWINYPVFRLIFKGLPDQGFSIQKLSSLILLAYLSWISGSLNISVTRLSISALIFFMILLNLIIFINQRKEILSDISRKKEQILLSEIIFLILFIYFLIVRLGNPDLWHPYKGGEKPMDFSYLNAVIKTNSFPPYDPWYAGGYINYYYFGFVLASFPIKFLGIIPSVAYNLVLPTFFGFTGLAAFGLVWNFNQFGGDSISEDHRKKKSIISGLIAVLFVLLIGNLATAGMILSGLQQLGSNANSSSGIEIISQINSMLKGVLQFLSGSNLNYYPGDWYWIPSRTIPGEPITEFPYFSFLYADPHAHLFAYPITILVLVWLLSVKGVLASKEKSLPILNITFGAIIVGCLRITNTWDYPTLLFISAVSLFYIMMRYSSSSKKIFKTNSDQKRRLINSLLIITGFVLVSYFLFFPFSKWYGQGYSTIQPWKGERTPIGSFITHWGFFIFIIYSYLLFEIKRWMEITPLISLKKYYQHRRLFAILLIFLLGITAILFFTGIEIVSILLPGIVISSLLIIVKAKSDELKFVLSIVLVGLIIVLGVELVVLQGDIGRMNTVFKFYLQAWTFLSLGSAILLSELSESRLIKSHESACRFWRGILMMLTFSVILFPITATVDKINDRISHNTPITLDGLEYMKYSSYSEGEEVMDLEQDYQAIRWMQESIIGTPVIMEANTPEYRWGNRISIYTGLPSIVGWNWHQRQQRSINPGEWVFKRVEDVTTFYDALDVASALEIIKKYQVQYIVVGQLEKALYQEAGIQKFDEFNNRYWKQVFSYKDTKIYQVIG